MFTNTECFICCSSDGKSEGEKTFEIMANQKYLDYPLLLLSKAYDCKCTSYAHNKCLLNINKCPTCRKVVQYPKLYVETNYDYYLFFLLDWTKKDISRIEKIKMCAIYCIVIVSVVLFLCDKNKDKFNTIIPPKSNESLCFAIIIGVMYFSSLYSIILDDYFKKYWLYDSKHKKCYVFNYT